jgi:hypothetical protein
MVIVTLDVRPVVRRYPARVYPIASMLLLVAMVQFVILLALGSWLWAPVVLALGVGGVVLAYKSIPFDHVRFTA